MDFDYFVVAPKQIIMQDHVKFTRIFFVVVFFFLIVLTVMRELL